MGAQLKSGDKANAILRAAVNDGVYVTARVWERKFVDRLVATRTLSVDANDENRFYPTDKARAQVAKLGEPEPTQDIVVVVAAMEPVHDASGLVETVERARALLDDGDVLKARIVAAGGYELAKTQADFGEKFGATEALVSKARRLQADALLIESRATMLISSQMDAARAAGLAASNAKGGRPKTVSDGNGLLVSDTGLTRKELHYARKMAEAERSTPGIVESAIARRVSGGLEPTRASLRAAVGARSATKEERGNNLYETPPEAMATLLALEEFSSVILDPSCGRGASGKPLEAAGYTVLFSDLVDYGTADQHGELQRVEDFLESAPYDGNPDIVTNPPYGAVLNRFIAHALRVHRPRKMALLLNYNFFCGASNDDRNHALDECPPCRALVFSHRLPMMHRDGWDGPEASSQMNTAWFIWELGEDGTYGEPGGGTQFRRVDWRKYVNAAASAESEAA